jgi:hypothetical protein
MPSNDVDRVRGLFSKEPEKAGLGIRSALLKEEMGIGLLAVQDDIFGWLLSDHQCGRFGVIRSMLVQP